MTDPATQAFRQIGNDPQTTTNLDPSEARSVIGYPTVHPGTETHQLDFDFAVAPVEIGMPDRICHQLMHDQPCQSASLGLERQRLGRQQKMNIHAVELGSTHSHTELSKIFRGVHQHVAIGHGQDVMNVGLPMKQLDDVAKGCLNIPVVGADRRDSDKVDRGGELVVDAVVLLADKGPRVQPRRKGTGHAGFLFKQTIPYSLFYLHFNRKHVKPVLLASLVARMIVNANG
jgi:hypothetical protein